MSLASRSKALQKVRSFFHERNVLEVDTPLLSSYAPIDPHIDIFEVIVSETERGYLHSSPEYGMKKLLAEGSGDIYQLGHVFRKNEKGPLHSPEFTMIEWYRVKTTLEVFLKENCDLLGLFLGDQKVEIVPYGEVFSRTFGLPHTAPSSELMARAKELGTLLHDPNDCINLIWGCLVEPTLGDEKITIVTEFPKEQAALAQIKDGVAERFEFYFKGIELGNGYHELSDPLEQKERLERSNQERASIGKDPFPIDPQFIKALEKGLPDCYGIALGFDRLLMLQEGHSNISSDIH